MVSVHLVRRNIIWIIVICQGRVAGHTICVQSVWSAADTIAGEWSSLVSGDIIGIIVIILHSE